MPKRRMVRLEDLIRVIFQELDLVQLKAMWDTNVETQDSMIEIIYALYLIKTRP
jgi:hypothetical protein